MRRRTQAVLAMGAKSERRAVGGVLGRRSHLARQGGALAWAGVARSKRERLISGGGMALNPKGFWRVLTVLYAFVAVTTAVLTGIAVSNELECPNRRANSLAEHRNWQQLPRCQHPLFSGPFYRCAGQPGGAIERAVAKARIARATED